VLIDVAILADRNVRKKENKVQEFMCRDTNNVDRELCDYTGNDWSHRNSNKSFKEKFGSHSKKRNIEQIHHRRQLRVYLERHTYTNTPSTAV